MLDGALNVGKTVKSKRQRSGGQQITRRGEFLAADHLFMVYTGQIDRSALTAMNFFHGFVVILKRAHTDTLDLGQPLYFVTDLDVSGRHGTCNHRAMAL